ncbi:MAG: hypothetical protein PWQ09_11 [Candidatus Cloacimonadota bacterium]|jgi:hypothetical protein|nr:hypothetical protein [Candidatus Cloacimonadota bacterium]
MRCEKGKTEINEETIETALEILKKELKKGTSTSGYSC